MFKLAIITFLGIILGSSTTSFLHSAEPPVDIEKRPVPDWIQTQSISQESLDESPIDELSNGQYYLLVDRQVLVQPQEPDQYFGHSAIYVINESGLKSSSEISIEFEPSYQSLAFHQIQIHRQGQVLDRLADTQIMLFRREENLEYQVYDGYYSATAIIEDIRVGDVIEYSYSLWGSNPIYKNKFSYWCDVGWSVPVKNHFWRLTWPKDRPLHIKKYHTSVNIEKRETSSQMIYSISQKKISGGKKNTQTPGWCRPFGRIQFSDSETWTEIVDWAIPLYRNAAKHNMTALKLATEIKQKHRTSEDRAVAALNYIQKEIRYLGIEMGENSHQPSPVDLTLSRRFGDCKDKSVLLVSILNAMGIEAYPALVNTYAKKTLEEYLPTINAFNHVIVKAHINGKVYWLDATRIYQGDSLHKVFQPNYAFALVISEKSRELTEMPPNDHLVKKEIVETFDLREGVNKPASYSINTTALGSEAEYSRYRLASDGSKQIETLYLDYYRKYYEEIETKEPIQFKDLPKENAFSTVEHYLIKEFWTNNEETKEYVCSFYSNAIDRFLNKPKQIKRKDPFYLDHPNHVTQNITILLPEPWDIKEHDFTEDNPFFLLRAKASLDTEKKIISLSYEYQSRQDSVPPEKIPEYISAIEKAEDELGYYLRKPYGEPETSESDQNVFSGTTIVVSIGSLLLIGLLYSTIEWLYDRRKKPPKAPYCYYPVSIFKLIFLTFITFGLYPVFWAYKNWKWIKQRDDSPIMPFWRAIFLVIWLFPLYSDMVLDSEERHKKSLLPAPFWMVVLLCLYVIGNIFQKFDGFFWFIGLMNVLCLLPLANYVLYSNRTTPEIIQFNSRFKVRHYFFAMISLTLLAYIFSTAMVWIPNGEVVNGHQMVSRNLDFMQKRGLLTGEEKLLYFYSDSFLFFNDDGNGITDQGVFSYWRDEKTGDFYSITAKYSEITDIKVKYGESFDENTLVTVKRNDGDEFVLFASMESGKDKAFVEAIQNRLETKEEDSIPMGD